MLQGHTERTVPGCPDGRACPFVREMLVRIGDKWSVLVVVVLGSDGRMRFSQLKREIIGISQRMLTLTMRNLERDGLVAREVFPTMPPRVDYRLTPLGQKLLEVLRPLKNWAIDHKAHIEGARSRFDGRTDMPTL